MKNGLYPRFSVLLVDDEPAWLDSLSLSLERTTGITNILISTDSREVPTLLKENDIGLIILDLTMPHMSGQKLLEYVSENHPLVKIIILTGLNQLETAVQCMKLGACDYFIKTDEEQRLTMGILSTIHMIELQIENSEMSSRLLEDTLKNPNAFSGIQSMSKQMRSIFQYIESIAKSSQPILITGESGVGKELVARSIHSLSEREEAMIPVNIAGLDDHMFSDTLFGHVKGAYTGAAGSRDGLIEKTSHGTLFLDEIGDLSIASQVKLLRVLNNGEYFPLGSDKAHFSKSRIVVATNQDLQSKIESGEFRKDLYYRLQTHRVHLPPLRERLEDIPSLLNSFIDEAIEEYKKVKPTISPELVPLLKSYQYPGNIRELRSIVYDAVARNKKSILGISSFVDAMGMCQYTIPTEGRETVEIDRRNIFSDINPLPKIDENTKLLIDEAMKRTGNNQSVAARMLGLSQSALNKRLKKIMKKGN